MIPLSDVVDACKAEAIANKLSPNELSYWRYFCREYSKTFHTPLMEVLSLPVEHVVLSVFEDQIDKRRLDLPADFDMIVQELRRLEDPEYDVKVEKEMDDFVKNIESWEEKRQLDGAPIPKPSRKKDPEPPKPEEPKQGFIDLSYLEKEDQS